MESGTENEKPKCMVRGVIAGGRGACGNVITGGEFCSLARGECDLQERGQAPAPVHFFPAV